MYFIYILVCLETRRSYVGQTDNLIRRYQLHLAGSTRTTREKLRRPVMLYWESFLTRAAVMHRERYFKAGAGHRLKQFIINTEIKRFDADGWNILPYSRIISRDRGFRCCPAER